MKKRHQRLFVTYLRRVLFNTFQPKSGGGLTWISQAAHKHYQQIIKKKISLLVFTQLWPVSAAIMWEHKLVPSRSVC